MRLTGRPEVFYNHGGQNTHEVPCVAYRKAPEKPRFPELCFITFGWVYYYLEKLYTF